MPMTFEYPALALTAIDGDSVAAVLILGDKGLRHYDVERVIVRLHGIDTPELRRDERERPAARHCLQAARGWLERHPCKQCKVVSLGMDKFAGRIDGEIVASNGDRLGQWMLDSGFANVLGPDGKRDVWTDEELTAILKLPIEGTP